MIKNNGGIVTDNGRSSPGRYSCSGYELVSDYPGDHYPEGSEVRFVIPEGVDKGKKLFFYDKVFGEGEPEAAILEDTLHFVEEAWPVELAEAIIAVSDLD